MKTAVSIPDEVFKHAERLAQRMKTSRSRPYSRAVAEFVARHSSDEVTGAMNRVVDEVGGDNPDFRRRATKLVFKRVEW